jgi:hypothetical protein
MREHQNIKIDKLCSLSPHPSAAVDDLKYYADSKW